MEKLFLNLKKFKKEDFLKYAEMFNDISDSQSPHTLFVGCSDSRVVPNLITKTFPGELFVLRNIANMVPPYRVTNEYLGAQSVVEYAVNVLNVENIVVCGHSNCGGCNAILHYDDFNDKKLTSVKNWLKIDLPLLDKVQEILKDSKVHCKNLLVEQLNIIHQMENLMTFPYIKDSVNKGNLKIFGWYYVIKTGDVFNYNTDTGFFELVN